jgi:hypothetical protein
VYGFNDGFAKGASFDPGKYYKRLMSAVVGVLPTLANSRIEEIAQ